MIRLVRIAALLGLALTATSARAALENRAGCYAAVIASCNTKAHPEPCIDGGLSQCVEQFK